MAAINFPNSPTLQDIYLDSDSGNQWQWDGEKWKAYSRPLGYTGSAATGGEITGKAYAMAIVFG